VTLAVGGAGLAGAYFSYSPEIAARCSFCCANLVEALWLCLPISIMLCLH
jgi:hypothetical protein